MAAIIQSQGFRKGEGKDGNYGVRIPAPSIVTPGQLQLLQQQAAGGPAAALIQPPQAREERVMPDPIPATNEEIDTWLNAGVYRPLTGIATKEWYEAGDAVLWRGVAQGPRGGPSTKNEWFNGTVRFLQQDPQGEWYYYVD